MQRSDRFGEYIIFVDESGDHNLRSINPQNPVFVLVFCIFKKDEYCTSVKNLIAQFKMNYWGHDLAILHNHSIRKSTGDFLFLFNEEKRRVFLHSLSETIKNIPFQIITAAIDKRALMNGSNIPKNPYFLALEFCLEHTYRFLDKEMQLDRLTHIIVESRGKNEDKELEEAFEATAYSYLVDNYCPFLMKFADKKTNSSGLQIADLVAYPIARYATNPDQPRRDFEIVKQKLMHYLELDKSGLKLFSR